jgi:hypothetical protein
MQDDAKIMSTFGDLRAACHNKDTEALSSIYLDGIDEEAAISYAFEHLEENAILARALRWHDQDGQECSPVWALFQQEGSVNLTLFGGLKFWSSDGTYERRMFLLSIIDLVQGAQPQLSDSLGFDPFTASRTFIETKERLLDERQIRTMCTDLDFCQGWEFMDFATPKEQNMHFCTMYTLEVLIWSLEFIWQYGQAHRLWTSALNAVSYHRACSDAGDLKYTLAELVEEHTFDFNTTMMGLIRERWMAHRASMISR